VNRGASRRKTPYGSMRVIQIARLKHQNSTRLLLGLTGVKHAEHWERVAGLQLIWIVKYSD